MRSIAYISLILLITCGSSTMNSLNTSNSWEKSMPGNRELPKAVSILNIDNLPNDVAVRQTSPLKIIAGRVNTILGFGSSILSIVGFFTSLFGGDTKYNIDDIMNQLNTQFADVKNQLSVIYLKMQKNDIDAYRAVENAVTAANSDIMLNSTLDLISRGLRLSDQLFIFSRGMLGQNGFSADILQVTNDILPFKCASTSIFKRMQKYIDLVNIGGLGLAYYGRKIGDSFNVNARAKMLDEMKSQIQTRTNKFITNCQLFTVEKVNGYITTILSSMQNSSPWHVAQALYSYLDDVYTQSKNFLFYVAQNFDRHNTVKFGYWGGGLQGNTANGVWTVYWAATPISPKNDVQWLHVDSASLYNTILTDPVKSSLMVNADFIYSHIKSSAFSGRKNSCLLLVVMYGSGVYPSPAFVGSPFRLNTWNFRLWSLPDLYTWTSWMVDIIVQ